MASNTLVTLNQVIVKRRQNHQRWDINDGVMLQRKYIQIKRLQDMQESTMGLNDGLDIKITSAEHFARKKKEENKNFQKRFPKY